MLPTQKSIAAYNLGVHFQQLNFDQYKPVYDGLRKIIQEALDLLGVPVQMPASVNEYDVQKYELLPRVHQHFEFIRSQLGGDVLSLPMFHFGYMPIDLVTASYYQLSTFDAQVDYFASVLRDLRIETTNESLRRFLAMETTHLTNQVASRGGHLYLDDITNVALRLTNRVTQLARAADKLTVPLNFDSLPYHSVFISYSTVDETFAEKLYHALMDAGIRVWYAPHDITPGKKIHHQIHQAIDRYDKLLLVLSEASMKSNWVGVELFRAREREQNKGVQMLFPVRLAPIETIKKWTLFDADSGRDLAREVREYFIPDFSQWANDETFLKQVHRLVEVLLVEEAPQSDS